MIPGFHVYQNVWSPIIGEWLPCVRELSNAQDPFAVSVMKSSTMVGHIQRKASSICSLNAVFHLSLFQPKWHITCSSNHRANEQTMMDYFKKILIPYISDEQKELKLQAGYPFPVSFDKFVGQRTDSAEAT